MRLYEIDQAIAELIDPETGELLDYEAFEALQMQREEKLENMALWYKDLCAEVTALETEIANLTERKKAAENKAESLKRYLDTLLAGEKFKTARCDVSFRKSTAVKIEDEKRFIKDMSAAGMYQYLSYKEPTVNKAEVTNALKSGSRILGAALVEQNNMQIK